MDEGAIVRPAGHEDLEAVVALLNKESLRYSEKAEYSSAEISQEWTEPGRRIERDTRVVVDEDGQCVAYVEYTNTRPPYIRPFVYCCVDPDRLETFDWSELLNWALDRAESEIERAPSDLQVTLLAGSASKNTRMLESWKSRGFVEARRFYGMKIDFNGRPTPPTVPDGYEVRPIRDSERRKVYDALMEAFGDHYGFVKPKDPEVGFKRWTHYFFESDEYDPDMMLIAVSDDEEIAGASLCKPNHGSDTDMGWVNSLAVGRIHRRKGGGGALLRESFVVMHGRGKKRAGLGVDASSLTNATRLYEKCGMQPYDVFVQLQKILREGRELANLGE